MVELSSSNDPFQHGFPNAVFIIPAIVVIGLGAPKQRPDLYYYSPVWWWCAQRKMGDVAEELFNAMGGPEGGAGAAAESAPGAENPFNPEDFKMPTMEDFLSMLEGMDNLSDEEKEELKAGVLQNAMRRKMQAGLTDYLVFLVMLAIMLAVFGKTHTHTTKQKMATEHEENPFVEALNSAALGELLQDAEKRSLAQQFQDNLRTLSDMFVNLSDEEKRQFARDFKGKFVKSLAQLNEFSKQKKIVQSSAPGREEEPEGSRLMDTLAKRMPGVGMLWTEQFQPTPIGYGLLAGVVVTIVAFFGYKLYLSLTEKERKREEKLKAKQEKSKKKK
uniref:Uncharacterized protein n=2 Tax=Anopheles arabiensis TaxID=7173 RepID=A0A182HWG4_ANOAR